MKPFKINKLQKNLFETPKNKKVKMICLRKAGRTTLSNMFSEYLRCYNKKKENERW